MESTNLTNQLLIAMPTLTDPNFFQTVTFICAHNEDGAMGIIVNRPLNIGFREVLSQMELETEDPDVDQIMVFQGGPVQRDRGFILFNPPSEWASTINVSQDFAVATSRDILDAISRGEGPDETLVALGYAGWGAGQLEQEIADNAWFIAPPSPELLFQTPYHLRWHRAAEQAGINLEQMSSDVGHA